MKIVLVFLLCFSAHAFAAYVYEKPAESADLVLRDIDDDLDFGKVFGPNKFGSNKFGKNQCEKCLCGAPSGNRIVGGTQVRSNKYPWTTQLMKGKYFKRLFCGGSLINDRYVLTAAHCVHGVNIARDPITVRMLQLDRSDKDPGVTREVIQAIVHPSYDPVKIVNDVALLKLDSPITVNTGIRPVCLPSPNHNFDRKDAIVAGWGLVKEGGVVSNTLQEVVVPIITNDECNRTRYNGKIRDVMLCAGLVKSGGKDACQGDSGGPLIVNEGRFKLAGVVSFGYGCAQANAPGVYARVSHFVPWIESATRDACYCSN